MIYTSVKAGEIHKVECWLAKSDVASSNLAARSNGNLLRLDFVGGIMYNVNETMGVYHEDSEPPNESGKVAEDKPPSTKRLLEDTRGSLQSGSADRLSGRSLHSDSVGNGISYKRSMAYILLAPGAKPHFGYRDNTLIH